MTRRPFPLRLALAALLAPALSGCLVGPNYVRPAPLPAASGSDAPSAFKEAQGFVPAKPLDAVPKGDWWSVFGDPTLDGLMRRVAITNQNVAQAEANYRNARALVDAARAQLFPTVTANLNFQRTGTLGNGGNGAIITTGAGSTGTVVSSAGGATNSFDGSLDASWTVDLWGRVRRQIEQARATAQSDAALLQNATLSAQGTLATAYFNMRQADQDRALLADTVAAYQKSLTVTQNQYTAGIVAKSDVITAQTQLQDAQAQLIDVEQVRQTYEHAIAVLVGVAPAQLTLTAGQLPTDVPVAPAGLPSELLERRPDVASAERLVKAANANVGVAISAYYPSLTLSGSLGSNANDFGRLFDVNNSIWSLGASAAETLLDFGARRAAVREARAQYDAQVAAYRQTVLGAFQNVEDQLVMLRVLQNEQLVREHEVESANLAVKLALNQYRAGTQAYTQVVIAQAQALGASQTLLQVRAQRLNASVALIQSLGGGWTQGDLPRG